MQYALLLASGVVLGGLAVALRMLVRERASLTRLVESLVTGERMRSRWRRWHNLGFVATGVALAAMAGGILAMGWAWPARDWFVAAWVAFAGVMLPVGVWSWLGRARDEVRYRASRPKRWGTG